MNHEVMKNTILKDNEIKCEYDKLSPVFDLKKEIIMLRIEYGLSQKDLAELIGTKQSAISRLENGTYNPSIDFLNRIARALKLTLHISFY